MYTIENRAKWWHGIDLDSFQDASEFLKMIVDGDIVNEHPKKCEGYANDFHKYLETILIPKMKDQSLEFRYLYSRIYKTGSYYDGLRIVTDSRNTELDINIVLSLFTPAMNEYFNADDVHIINDEKVVPNGFVKILCDQKRVNGLEHKKGDKFKTKCNFKRVESDKIFLHPNKTLRWFCDLVKKASREITPHELIGIESFSEVPKVLNRQGPSQKIQVTIDNDGTKTKQFLDVDLVVAFEFDVDLYKTIDYSNANSYRNLKDEIDACPSFFTIPKMIQTNKEYQKEKQATIKSSSDSLNWRIDFHEQERIILNALKFPLAKPVIQILKLYKYVHTLTLCSYLIKSVVMGLITSESDKHVFFPNNKLDEAVLYTLKVLCSFLEKQMCPYLFDPKCNLFWKTSPDDLFSIKTKIEKDIERLKCGGIKEWHDLLIKKLPLKDERCYVNRGRDSRRSEAWKPQVKRNNNYQQIHRESSSEKYDEEEKIMMLGCVRKPNRVVNRRPK